MVMLYFFQYSLIKMFCNSFLFNKNLIVLHYLFPNIFIMDSDYSIYKSSVISPIIYFKASLPNFTYPKV